MKKAIIALLCLALIAGGGYFGYRHYLNARDEKKVVKVVPVNLMAQPAEWFMYTGSDTWGYISAANAQKVYVDTDKLVKNVFVKQGQTVKKGDTILEYDMTVVELELTQKENQVHLIEQDIKMAKKELAKLKGLHPSEEMPEPNIPDEPDVPDEPEEPEEPEEPVMIVEELVGGMQPVSGTGTPDDPFIYNCSVRTVVRQPFMLSLAGAKRCAALHVFSDDGVFLYRWIIAGDTLNPADAEEWTITDGLIFDEESGTVTIDPAGKLHGQISFAMPQSMMPQDSDEQPDDALPDDFDFEPEDTSDQFEPVDYGEDYMYPRSELKRMIAEKENEIKELEISLKSANLAYENAKKQKSDGKVVATIDGTVKKIGKAADDLSEDPAEETDPFAEPSEDDNAFAVIEGAGGVEVICEVPELTLPKLPAGTIINVMSYQNGASTEAEVTGVDEEPTEYSANPWQANPNSSMYKLHAKLLNSDDFIVGNGVQVSLPQDSGDSAKKNSVFIPIHYVRQQDGDYYIMKADENDRLTKQYIGVGQILWGMYIEVTGGLDVRNDRICFPYGTDVKEGVRTEESTEVQMPNGYY